MSLVTFGLGVGALVTGGLGGFYGDAPQPPVPPPYQTPTPGIFAPASGGAGGPGGSLPGDIEFGEPAVSVGNEHQPLGPPDPGFWLSPGVTVGTERTAGCTDAGKVVEAWSDDSEPRGQDATAGCTDAGKVIEEWVKKT